MRNSRLLTCILMLAASAARGQSQEPAGFRVLARLDWEAGGFGASAPRQITLGAEPPAGVKLPEGISSPQFGRLALGNGSLVLALDANPGFPRLWVDRDLDGDLAEERTTQLTRQGDGFSRSQVVLVPYDGESDPAPLELLWACDLAAGQPKLSARLMMHRRGTVVLGGRLRLLALTDGNADGRFDDGALDRIYLDSDGDGNLQYAAANDERILLGQPFRVGDEGWIVRVVSPSGRAVEFERCKTVPPAAPRVWPEPVSRPAAGLQRTPPQESLAALLERFERERSRLPAERLATVSLIGCVGTAEAFDALDAIAASEQDYALRAAALRALGNPAFLAARGDRLADLARKAGPQSVAALAQALFDAGHPERDAIYLEMLASSDPMRVMAAARWLAYSGSEQATRAILAAVEEAGTPGVRAAAYRYGARNLPGGPPIDTVLRAARDDYAPLRADAIKDLGVLGHPDAVRLALQAAAARPVDLALGKVVCEVLGATGTPIAVAALLSLLEDDGLHSDVRMEVVDQLRLVRSPESIDVLVKALGSKRPAQRAVAAEILSATPERRVTAALLERAEKEKDEEVLPRLLEGLGDHGDPIALPALQGFARSRQPAVRTAAVRALARIGFQHEKVRAFFLSLLESREWTDRVLALDAAKAARDASLLPKVLKSIDHEVWQVRLAAVEALAALRARDAVLPLIDRLEVEEQQRIRDTVARTLFELTGVNGYDNVETWRRWWSEKGATFAVPEEVPVLPERTAGGTSAGFYGIPVSSERVVFLIDQSGSMSAVAQEADNYRDKALNRLEVAVRETLGALAALNDRARVNVIMFHSTFQPWQDELQRLGPNRKKLERMLESQTPMGGTNIYDGLEFALRMPDVDTIFLLSDGAPGQGKFVAKPDILRNVRRENQTRRIVIHCVAVGMDSALLRELAAENGGSYVQR